MITEELISFIKSELALGKRKEQISAELLAGGGWKSGDLDEAFLSLNKPIEPISTTSPQPQPQPQPQSQSQPKNTNKVLIVVLILFLLLGTGVSAYFFKNEILSITFVKNLINNEKVEEVITENIDKIENVFKKEDEKNTNLIKFTSKTHNFSFEHLDFYLNFEEKYSLEEKKRCPSGDQDTCDKDILDLSKKELELECQKEIGYYKSISDCLEVKSKEILDLFAEFRKIKISQDESPIDREGVNKFYTYLENGEPNDGDSFSYSVFGLDETIAQGRLDPKSQDIPYTTVATASFTDKNGKVTETKSYDSSTITPWISYVFIDGKLNKVSDITRSLKEIFNIETRIENNELYKKRKTFTVIDPYFVNENGVSFYKIHTPDYYLGEFFNCAVKNKIVCFIFDGTNSVSREEILKPIEKSFVFLDKEDESTIIENIVAEEIVTPKKSIVFKSLKKNLGTKEDAYVLEIFKEFTENANIHAINNLNKYKGVCEEEEDNISESLYFHGFNVTCFDDINHFAYSINLPKGLYYCVDDTGIANTYNITQSKFDITGPKCN